MKEMEFVWGEEEEDIWEKVMATLREEEKLREMVRSQEETEAERQEEEERLKEARKRVREEIEAEEWDRLVEELRKEERQKIRGGSGPRAQRTLGNCADQWINSSCLACQH